MQLDPRANEAGSSAPLLHDLLVERRKNWSRMLSKTSELPRRHDVEALAATRAEKGDHDALDLVVQSGAVFGYDLDNLLVGVRVDPDEVKGRIGVFLDVSGSERLCNLLDALVLPASGGETVSGEFPEAGPCSSTHQMRMLPLPSYLSTTSRAQSMSFLPHDVSTWRAEVFGEGRHGTQRTPSEAIYARRGPTRSAAEQSRRPRRGRPGRAYTGLTFLGRLRHDVANVEGGGLSKDGADALRAPLAAGAQGGDVAVLGLLAMANEEDGGLDGCEGGADQEDETRRLHVGTRSPRRKGVLACRL